MAQNDGFELREGRARGVQGARNGREKGNRQKPISFFCKNV